MNKFGQHILNFFKSLFSANGEVSSKHVVGFGSFLLLTSMVIVNETTGRPIQEALVWSVVSLIVACFGLNALIAMKAISAKSQVASDIAKESPDEEAGEQAKDVLNSDKP